jgi:hypothetical protein
MNTLFRLCEVTRFPQLVAFRHASEDRAASSEIRRSNINSSAQPIDRPLRPNFSASRLTLSTSSCRAFSSSASRLAFSSASRLAFSSASRFAFSSASRFAFSSASLLASSAT